MEMLATAVGAVIVLVSLYLEVSPQALQRQLPDLFSGANLYLLALGRLLIGCLLLAVASGSRHPEVMAGLGWLTVLAGLLLVAIPPATVARIANWYAQCPVWALRAMLLLSLAFGAYIIYEVH